VGNFSFLQYVVMCVCVWEIGVYSMYVQYNNVPYIYFVLDIIDKLGKDYLKKVKIYTDESNRLLT
jgi:hypothetical protein